MCKIFISADPELYRCRSRSLRLSIAQLITRLYEELADTGGDCTNFSSFLRVSCLRYLALQLSGRIPADIEVPIRSLDADWVLAGEKRSQPLGEKLTFCTP
jgi:predicted DNA-binding ribbon-helix-helix protein